jgi:hypothetical protein
VSHWSFEGVSEVDARLPRTLAGGIEYYFVASTYVGLTIIERRFGGHNCPGDVRVRDTRALSCSFPVGKLEEALCDSDTVLILGQMQQYFKWRNYLCSDMEGSYLGQLHDSLVWSFEGGCDVGDARPSDDFV